MDDVLRNRINCTTVETLHGHSVITTINDVTVCTVRYLNKTQVHEHVEAQVALFEALQQQIRQKLEAAQPLETP